MIALKTGENEYLSIRCHLDGYPSHNGAILLDSYGTEERVRALLALGNLSSLGLDLGDKHTRADNRHPEWCLADGRDLNEENAEAYHRLIEELTEDWINYVYLFDPERSGGEWLVSRDGRAFTPLAEHPDLANKDEADSVVAVARRRVTMREESQAALAKTLARIDGHDTSPLSDSYREYAQQVLTRLYEMTPGLGEPDEVKVAGDAVTLVFHEDCADLAGEFRIAQGRDGSWRFASCMIRTEQHYGNTEDALKAFAERFGSEE